MPLENQNRAHTDWESKVKFPKIRPPVVSHRPAQLTPHLLHLSKKTSQIPSFQPSNEEMVTEMTAIETREPKGIVTDIAFVHTSKTRQGNRPGGNAASLVQRETIRVHLGSNS